MTTNNVIARMNAAERAELAKKIEAANEHMSHDERRNLIDTLTVALASDSRNKSDADKRHDKLVRIHAAENGEGKLELRRLNYTLRAKGVDATLQDLAFKSVKEIDTIFASSRMTIENRIEAKAALHRLFGY